MLSETLMGCPVSTPINKDFHPWRTSSSLGHREPLGSRARALSRYVRSLFHLSVSAFEGAHVTLDDLARLVATPPIEYRPELRWWLAEGLHTDQTPRLRDRHRSPPGVRRLGIPRHGRGRGRPLPVRLGFGGVGARPQIVVEETTKRGMSVSFTSGTNWSNANLPTITPERPAAAKELNFVFEDLQAGTARTGPLPRIDLDQEPPPAAASRPTANGSLMRRRTDSAGCGTGKTTGGKTSACKTSVGDFGRQLGRRRNPDDCRGPRTRLPDPRGETNHRDHPDRGRYRPARGLEGHPSGGPGNLRHW